MEIDWGAGLVRVCFAYLNLSLATGLVFLGMLALRPVTTRLITPQQRVLLWAVGWFPAYLFGWYGMVAWVHVLPVTFRDLITPRVDMYGNSYYDLPAYLPGDFYGPGRYNLALPGGAVCQVNITWGLALALLLIWVVGMVIIGVIFWRRSKSVRCMMEEGEALLWNDPLLEHFPGLAERCIQVRLCDGLPTSFLFGGHANGVEGIKHTICLQRELPREQLELVLRHELAHIQLLHSQIKSYANVAMVLHWWNPVMWVSHKYFCRDLELACDRAALNKLEPPQRREYAKTLVELGAGQQLWDAPLCFGECDAELRVRAAVAWKEPGWLQKAASGAVFLLLLLFFLGGPGDLQLPQDVLLTWEKGGGTVETLVEDATRRLEQAEAPAPARQMWCAVVSNRYSPVIYAQLADGSWWEISYFWNSPRDQLYSHTAWPQEKQPDVREMYRLM